MDNFGVRSKLECAANCHSFPKNFLLSLSSADLQVMSTAQLNAKVPEWYIHLRLLTMENPENHPMTIEKFIESTFLPTRFLGVYARSKSKGNIRPWKAYSWLLLIAILVNTLFCLYCYKDVYPSLYVDNSLRLCLDRFHFFIATFSAGFCVLYEQVSGDDYGAIFNHVGGVDVVLMGLGLNVKFSYARTMIRLALRMTGVCVFTCIYAFHLLFDPQNYTGCTAAKLSTIIGMSVTYCIVVVMEYQHSELMRSVGLRFKIIKDRVVELGKNPRAPSITEMAEFESLVKVYNQLNETCIIINDMFGKQILFVVGTIFATVTSCANYIVQDVVWLITERSISSPQLLLLNGYWGVSRLLELWFIIVACDSVVERAKEFTTELYQLMIKDDSLRMSKNRKLYMHVSSQTEPLFTAYGFFTLDNALFHSVVAAATTYIVILIQFSQNNSNSETATVSPNATTTTTPKSSELPSTPNSSALHIKPDSYLIAT